MGATKKFNVGDRVRVLRNSRNSSLPVGSIHTVSHVFEICCYLTQRGTSASMYFFDEIELVKDGVAPSTNYPYETPNPLNVQVGGEHYKKYKIQPIEYAMANKLDACQFNVVKYVTRFRDKGGVESLRKAIHQLEILIHMEEHEIAPK